MKTLSVFFLAVLLSGCGGSYVITRTAAPTPARIEVVAIAPLDGNSAEVDGYVKAALIGQGLVVKVPLTTGTRSSLEVDAIVSYQDIWRWDITTYLAKLTISLYDASSGSLLATGKWEDSFFHTWNRGEAISQELLKQLFVQLRGAKKGN